MLTRSELPENPVVLVIRDTDGHQNVVTTERVRGGKIRMTCTCDQGDSLGWCEHRVQLLCLRYDSVVESSDDMEFHFEDIVMGTPLADCADEVEVALADFRAVLCALDTKHPPVLNGDGLRALADRARDLADATTQLEIVLGRFRKQLAAGLA
jgi:hypothetical protein